MEAIEDVRIKSCTSSKYVQPFRVLYKQNGKQHLWDCVKMHDALGILIFNRTRNAFVVVKQFRPPVYMNKNRAMWEKLDVFPDSLSQKPSSSASDDQTSSSSSDKPPSKQQKLEATATAATGTTSEEPPPTWGPSHEGFTYELCAGLVDKDIPLELIAKEEILEETGYDVPVESLEKINWHHSNIGTAGTKMHLFYCEVTDDMQATSGGGNTVEGESIEVVYIPLEKSLDTVFEDSLSKSSSLCIGFLWFDKYKKPSLINNT